MRRAVIFAHYDRDGEVDPHVHYLLGELRKNSDKLIFVSTSASEASLGYVRAELADIAIARENTGYDFMSWRLGYSLLENKQDFDEVVFANDSIYGPLFDLGELFQKLNSQEYYFWGLSRSNEVFPHVQSYFFGFRQRLITKGVVDEFWESVEILNDKWEVIEAYEIGLSRFMANRCPPQKIGVLFDQKKLSFWQRMRVGLENGKLGDRTRYRSIKSMIRNRTTNPNHRHWRSIIRYGVPFLKVELLRDNPYQIDSKSVFKFLESNTNYDRRLIENHLKRVTPSGY